MLKRLLKMATAVAAFLFLKMRYLLAAILIALGVSQVSAQTNLVANGHFLTTPGPGMKDQVAPWTVNLYSPPFVSNPQPFTQFFHGLTGGGISSSDIGGDTR